MPHVVVLVIGTVLLSGLTLHWMGVFHKPDPLVSQSLQEWEATQPPGHRTYQRPRWMKPMTIVAVPVIIGVLLHTLLIVLGL